MRKQFLAELIFWDQLIEVLRDPNHDIQANLVSEAEGGRIGSTDQRSGDGVNLFDAIPIIECIIHGLHAAVASDPVSNEIGRVFRNHHTLAQPALSKSAHVFHYLGIGIRGRDDLKELEIAWWVKKVGSQETAFEGLGAAFSYPGEGNTGSVGGDNGVRVSNLLNACHQLLLGLQFFKDSFQNPVSLFQALKVIFEVSKPDVLSEALLHESRRFGFQHPLKAGLDDRISFLALGSRWHDIQKVNFQASVCCMGGYGRAHRSSPQHSNPLNGIGHDATSKIFVPFGGKCFT